MNVTDQVFNLMRDMSEKFSASGIALQMPPASVVTLGTQYTEIDQGKMLTAKVEYNSKFANPLQVFQGGFLTAIFDDAFGPLSYMAAERPAMTIEMGTTFIRPFTAQDEYLLVRAEVVAKTKTLLVMKAEARNKDGKLIAVCNTSSVIMTDQQLAPRPIR